MYKVAYYQHFENNESALTHSNEKFLRQMLKIAQTYGYKDKYWKGRWSHDHFEKHEQLYPSGIWLPFSWILAIFTLLGMYSLLMNWPQIQSREKLVTLNSSATNSLVDISCLGGQYYGMQSLRLDKAIFFSPSLQFPAQHFLE